MTDNVMQELRALCDEYAQLTTQRDQIVRRVETLLAPKEPKPETTDDEIKVGDLVEVVSAGIYTDLADIGKGGIVQSILNRSARVVEHPQYQIPRHGYVTLRNCRKVAAHVTP